MTKTAKRGRERKGLSKVKTLEEKIAEEVAEQEIRG